MGRYLDDARHHQGRIKHYHEYGGENGYVQASHHFNELGKLLGKADKGDAPVIAAIHESASKLMKEMESRAKKG